MIDEILNQLQMKLVSEGRLSDDIRAILNNVQIVLYDYDITKKENSLSTVVTTPNELYIRQFLAIKKVNGLSDRSLKAYKNELFLMFRFIDKPVQEITPNDIRYYLALEKTNKTLSNSYLDTKLRYMRSFFKTLRIEGLIPTDPTERISKIKTPKVIKKPFTDEEIEILRNEARKNLRTLAIFEFLCSTGCRVSEVESANRTDIENDKIIIHGKGDKQRYVYLNAKAILAINNYIKSRNDNHEALFIGYRHNCRNTYNRLSHGSIEAIIRKLGRAAGVENCHPHRFRRTMATQALRRGMPIEQVSLLLGHDQLTTTQIYARSEESDIQAAHKKYC